MDRFCTSGSDELGRVLDKLKELHDAGRLESLMYVAKTRDGTYAAGTVEDVAEEAALVA